MSSSQVLFIPYTFGANFGKPGVTKEQIFWHLRNMDFGMIDHIDMTEKVDKKGINVRSWFVHFTNWTAKPEITEALERGSHIEIDYDNYGHFWKVFKYVPKTPPAPTSDKEPANFRIISPNVTPIKFAPIPKKNKEFNDFQNANEPNVPFVEGLTDEEYYIFDNMMNEFEDNVMQNRYGLKNESELPQDTMYYHEHFPQNNMYYYPPPPLIPPPSIYA